MNHRINARALHELLDDIAKGYQPHAAEIDNLRACLPEQPKQKTLVEIRDSVDAAWHWAANGNTWINNEKTLDMWLQEQKEQLDGLIDNGYTTPALPDGMRLAYHEEYGQVVVSPKSDSNGVCDILYIDSSSEVGTKYSWAYECDLILADIESLHPEFLETEEDYKNAPAGTIVAKDSYLSWTKQEGGDWDCTSGINNRSDVMTLTGGRRVLRWGVGQMSDMEECSTCGNPVDDDGLSTMDTRWCSFICKECHGCESCDGGC